ncbi:hypothetical protein DMENIID0001_125760 [Sergentomyia squamirostris]
MKFLLILLVVPLIVGSPETEKKIFCLHGKWSYYREGNGHFSIDQIDPTLCTHLIYAYFGIDFSGKIRISDKYLDLEENYGVGNLKKLTKLRVLNPKLKILAAIGGWTEGVGNFSAVANDPERTEIFVKDVVDLMKKYSFEGITLDWEYPGIREGSRSTDKAAYTALLAKLYKTLRVKGLTLTALVASERYTAVLAYDIPQISKYLDFILLKSFDMHGSWSSKIGSNAPLYGKSWETDKEIFLNINSGVFYWLHSGAPAGKLVIGVPTFGRGFKMVAEDQNVPGSNHGGASDAGPYSNEPGMLGYNELCELRTTEEWQDFWDEEQLVPFSTRGDQWIGYDNEESMRIKARYIRMYKLAGVMVGYIETDDFLGFCGNGPFSLLRALNRELKEKGPREQEIRRKVCLNTMNFS